MTDGEEIWDEERWEAFLRENDRRLGRYMDLLFRHLTDNPPPDRSDAAAWAAWRDDLRRFLDAHGFPPDAVPSLFEPESDEVDEPDDPVDDLRRVPVYVRAVELSGAVLEWSNDLPGAVKDSLFVAFCSNVTQIPAHVAKGHAMGYERDVLGGNIACVKRALAAANAALEFLPELRRPALLDASGYLHLYEQTFEVRNALGLYVQDLRRRFDLGVD